MLRLTEKQIEKRRPGRPAQPEGPLPLPRKARLRSELIQIAHKHRVTLGHVIEQILSTMEGDMEERFLAANQNKPKKNRTTAA